MRTKLTVNLGPEAIAALRSIAEGRGITLGQAIGLAIAHQKYFSDEVARGGKVLIERSDGTIREIVII